ncbi:hypothetical protein GGX14DRAFT_668945 [Mycena pura]|uniref:PHD-type domain-containing protein n=1 Tax=Mycena pura TaxID=153505 RepID=A0AAD6UXT6_9AGAR|nr:hypothetical protein GGX14DRAFT_668945 [Mycena pura]
MAATSMPAYLLPGVPVHQPSHLEGDPTLATEILPGPPSLLSVQQATQKRDPKKPVYSYLHPTDPGSTYSGIVHGTIIGQEEGARTLKGRRSAVSGRAQRASARNQNGAAPEPAPQSEVGGSQPVSVASESYIMVPDDETSLSRSNSAPNLQEGSAAAAEPKPRGKGRPKGKGKAKETEVPVRVKEEPQAVSLHTPEPLGNQINNEDHCSSCRSHGALVYCDGCPRAFHLWCLNPPMEHIDEGDSRWFCPACTIRKHPPRKPPPSLFSPLIHLVQTSIPTEYQLPEDVRTFFRDVGTGPKGTYVDVSLIRQPRLNRFGLVEDRDAFRLRDKNGDPVLCFKCGTSALPSGLAAVAPAAKRARRSSARVANAEIWKSMVSCDYCNLHWHLDCLDPPQPTMPPINKKWMCPNHAERVLLPKLRIPKNAAAIEITKPKQFNNGNIEIIHPQTASTSQMKKVAVEEVLINGRRYRVPERIVILDFWNKVSNKTNTNKEGEQPGSGLSSPLTSLSSLDDLDERIPSNNQSSQKSQEDEDLRAAQRTTRDQRSDIWRNRADRAVQTDPDMDQRPTRASALKRTTQKTTVTNGQSHTPAHSADAGPSTSTAKRKRNVNGAQVATPSARELRPRTRHAESMISVSSKDSSSLDDPFNSAPSKSAVRVKTEEHENGMGVFGGSPVSKPATSSRGRPIRRPSQKGENPPKRGRKRKEREEDLSDDNEGIDGGAVEQPKKSRTEKGAKEKASKGKEKQKETKNPQTPKRSAKVHSAASSGAHSSAHAPSTPSLKIRLPPLSDIATRTSPTATRSLVDSSAHG